MDTLDPGTRRSQAYRSNALREQYYVLGQLLLTELPACKEQSVALKTLDTSMMAALSCLEASYAQETSPAPGEK